MKSIKFANKFLTKNERNNKQNTSIIFYFIATIMKRKETKYSILLTNMKSLLFLERFCNSVDDI
jgi:hypothetical protein